MAMGVTNNSLDSILAILLPTKQPYHFNIFYHIYLFGDVREWVVIAQLVGIISPLPLYGF